MKLIQKISDQFRPSLTNVFGIALCVTVICGSDNTPAVSHPLFLGYYEESHYLSPHYQSIVPFRDNDILKYIVENGGSAVASKFISSGEIQPVWFVCLVR